MQKKIVLNKLSQDLVNKIAAGEVIERPASVVKELVDNSIDANASKIAIKLLNGGIDLIEVSDNGVGIPKKNMEGIFDSHTTSKISSFEDLNTVLTMGFRGEALSTIVAVSDVRVMSKYENEDRANELFFKKDGQRIIRSTARESGTAVLVENLFNTIPARKKFLKSAQTEYKKILEILFPYFLIYPNIHFTVVKDKKTVLDIKGDSNLKAHSIDKERINSLIHQEYIERMLKVFFNGNGTKISGFVGHPSDHQKKVSQYLFVNGRPIKDTGIARSVYQGMNRFIPYGEKIPYILHLEINPELVDINVHPRKEEVRFLNPFRVYTAVQEAVRSSVESSTSFKVENRQTYIPNSNSYSPKDIYISSTKGVSVQDSLLFSKEVLTEMNREPSFSPTSNVSERLSIHNVFQIFNKYIVIEFNENILWIVDQHAAAERITFERLIKQVKLEQQKFLVPFEVEMSKTDLIGMTELKSFFSGLGFEYTVQKYGILLFSVPVEFVNADFKKFFSEIFALTDDIINISNEVERLKEDIYATMSCHGSVRSGQMLHREEMIDMYNRLIECTNPYSCPHGRPAVWKMKLSDIDMNFERTY